MDWLSDFGKQTGAALDDTGKAIASVVPSEIKLGFITVTLDTGEKGVAATSPGQPGLQARRGSDAGPKRPTPARATARRASLPNVTQRQDKDGAAKDQAGAPEKPEDLGKTGKEAENEAGENGWSKSHPYQHAQKMSDFVPTSKSMSDGQAPWFKVPVPFYLSERHHKAPKQKRRPVDEHGWPIDKKGERIGAKSGAKTNDSD